MKSNGSCEQDNFLFVGSIGYISTDLTEENQLQKSRPIKHQDIVIQGQASGLFFVSSLQLFYTDLETRTIRMLFNGSDEVLIDGKFLLNEDYFCVYNKLKKIAIV